MDKLFAVLTDGADGRVGGADSFIDRLSCRYSVFMLTVFAVLVSSRNFVGEPISCWVPSHFTSSHQEYTNRVCWTTNTYYLPFDEDRIPKEGKERKFIGYYQWVSLILACQAVLFYLPRPFWRLFNKQSGIAVSTITDAAIEYQRKMEPDGRDRTLRYMVKHMGRFLVELSRNQMMTRHCKSFWWGAYGNYLIMLYLFVKLIYIGNVFAQICLLNVFLGMDFHQYGWWVLTQMARGEKWSTSDRFPRVTLCDFKIRDIGNVNRYTVQCSLPVNLFNEKIFIFLWFWFAFVAFATFGSFLMWLFSFLVLSGQVRYVKTRLIAMEKISYSEKLDAAVSKRVQKFVYTFLRRDGLFLIRLVAKNASDLVAAELICGLWEHYHEHRHGIERLASRDDTHQILTHHSELNDMGQTTDVELCRSPQDKPNRPVFT